MIIDSSQDRQLFRIAYAAVVLYDWPISTTYDLAAGSLVAFCPETERCGYQLDCELIQQFGGLALVLAIVNQRPNLFDLSPNPLLELPDARIAAMKLRHALYRVKIGWAVLRTCPHWDDEKRLTRLCR